MSVFDFVILIILLSTIKGTVHKYLDYRMRMADRLVGGHNLLQVVEELRAEMAAMKRHETDTILSFDSTLQTLDARLKHLERAALEAASSPRPLTPSAGRGPVEETAQVEMTAGARPGTGSSQLGSR